MNAAVQALVTPPQAVSGQSEIERVFALQQARALELRTSDAAERIARIRRLRDAVLARREDIYAALQADFAKPEAEADLGEIMVVVQEANHAIRHLKRWMKPRKVAPTAPLIGTFSEIRYEPKGVTLIIAPWNFPVNLLFGPLVSAIAGGNTAIVKPSELTPNTSALSVEIIRSVFTEDEVAIFEGDAEVSQALLELPFDHCFFTGSPAVGKIVMAACARHLTSVTLELGGKSPVVIDASADIPAAARSLVSGKFQNAGQACIAPDYVLVHESVKEAFLAEFAAQVRRSYGADEAARAANPDLGRIVNQRHAARIQGLIDDALARGASAVIGGTVDVESRYVAPTLLSEVAPDSTILEEEIFGPVLPVIAYRELDEAIRYINARPKPLALYVYSRDDKAIRAVIGRTSSGDAAINTCVVHFVNHNLPFGGANNSGLGKAHGEYGFKAFSHERSVLRDRFALTGLFAAPYTPTVQRLIKLAVRFLS